MLCFCRCCSAPLRPFWTVGAATVAVAGRASWLIAAVEDVSLIFACCAVGHRRASYRGLGYLRQGVGGAVVQRIGQCLQTCCGIDVVVTDPETFIPLDGRRAAAVPGHANL